MLTLIKKGRVVDPGNLDGIMDILIDDDRIIEIIPSGKSGKGRTPLPGPTSGRQGSGPAPGSCAPPGSPCCRR